MHSHRIAVLIPCYNEETTVLDVIQSFQRALPQAEIVVGNNNSTDRTEAIARGAGVRVINVFRKGKGAVLRHLFRTVEADFYLMVDGDSTYPADRATAMLLPLIEGRADVVIGDRRANGSYKTENKRRFHGLGNFLVVSSINLLFNCRLNDIMSGYRAMTRQFVKNCPILVDGFAVETEMTLHSLDKLFTTVEIPIDYLDRPAGSVSKLSTFTDGFRVLRSIVWIFKDCKPLIFFGVVTLIGVVITFLSIFKFLPPALTPYLVFSTVVSLAVGLILDTLVKLQREAFEVQLMQEKGTERNRLVPKD